MKVSLFSACFVNVFDKADGISTAEILQFTGSDNCFV